MRRHEEDIERSATIARSASMRLADAVDAFRRSVYGDEEDPFRRFEDPPEVPRERSRRNPLWIWNRRMRGR